MLRKTIHFTVNGEFVELSGEAVFAPLSDTLRYQLRKTGTKVVCAEGDCGACTIMLARVTPQAGSSSDLHYRSLNSCIFPTFSADGCHIVTVEGLAQKDAEQKTQLNEIQDSMVRNFGGQCGFCTPGFVMSITNMYEQRICAGKKAEAPSDQTVKNYLTGNLCRCTGYQPIIEAAQNVDQKKIVLVQKMYPLKKETTQLKELTSESLAVETTELELSAPVTLKEAVAYKKKNPKARIFSGSTDIGVQINKGKDPGAKRLSLHLISELYEIAVKKNVIRIGARVTLDQVGAVAEKHLPAFGKFLSIFASPQIKNTATLVGNLANGSPIADTTAYLMAVDTEIEVVGPKGSRQIAITKFFKGYKELDLKEGEFITALLIPIPTENISGIYKVSQRRDLDISAVNASFLLKVDKKGKVESAKIAFGGVAAVPLRLKAVEEKIIGKKVDAQFVSDTKKLIGKNIKPMSDARGTQEYRELLAEALFEKFSREHLKDFLGRANS